MAVQEHMTVMATAPKPPIRRGNRPRASIITASGAATFTAAQRARLEKAAETHFHRRTLPLAPAELDELAAGATVLAVTPRSVPRLGPSIIERLPDSLRGIAVFATGVDFVDLEALERREIAMANLPDYSAASVAEHTTGLLLTMSRRIHLSRDRVLGRVPAGTSVRGWELAGKTIGIVGVGRIGLRVARLAQALGMRVVAADTQSPEEGVVTCDLDELLAEAHVVSLHLPHDYDGRPLLRRPELASMRPGAFLLNTSRAALVDEEAVVALVASGHLGGYAVDDRLSDRSAADPLVAQGRILETGHTAWYSNEALERGLETWVDNVVALARGRARNLVTRLEHPVGV
jgi:phosphoglycerate dehydrogenase-like enzyme